MRLTTLVVATLALGIAAQSSFAAEIKDTYLRKGDQPISVFSQSGKLYCRRVSDGFEMCNGMEKQADGTWQGKKMKHPDMPGFMTFNGTVVIGSNAKMSIKGCAMGQSLCDEEIWDKTK